MQMQTTQYSDATSAAAAADLAAGRPGRPRFPAVGSSGQASSSSMKLVPSTTVTPGRRQLDPGWPMAPALTKLLLLFAMLLLLA